MEVATALNFDIGTSSDKVSAWFADADVSSLLAINEDETLSSSLDLQSVPITPPDYLCMPSDSPLSSPHSPYSSPELPEMEGSFVVMEAPPLFDSQIVDVDMLFTDSLASVNPELLPELEKILSSVDTSISPPPSPTDQVVSGSRASKKRKGEDGKDCSDGVCLPRDQLLTMTSNEIEDYVTKLKSQRTLSSAEEKELKRQRRLIKNREYASQSRSRKKQYVDELEKALEEVRAENSSLKAQVGTLSDENRVLKKQITAIATTIKKSALSNSTSGVSSLSKLTTVGAGRSNGTKTVSACLMAIMLMAFTFSVFWDNKPMFQLGEREDFNAWANTKARRSLNELEYSLPDPHIVPSIDSDQFPTLENPFISTASSFSPSMDSASLSFATTRDHDSHVECESLTETKILGFTIWTHAQYNCTKATAA